MIPINDPRLLNSFHVDDLLKEAEQHRLVLDAEIERHPIGEQVLNATGNILISTGKWIKAHSSKHSLN